MRDAIALELTDIHGDSNIHMAREDFFPGEFGFTLQKGSPLKVKIFPDSLMILCSKQLWD